MNIIDSTVQTIIPVQQPPLPPLVKGSSTYKLFVPKKVEEKIRYLCRKFPTLEWSGVLFTTYSGNFEDGSLEIHCQDLYPMDLGTSTFTDFKMDESVAGYIAENIDLFNCDLNLIHSHNQMPCFFSGTDISTLRSEGNDQNCFVSLIVNNAGKYCAAITRKVLRKRKVITQNLGTSYEFFGEGTKYMGNHSTEEKQSFVDDTIIEYFMLNVQVEQVDNPLAYLDTRFDEIQQKKYKSTPVVTVGNTNERKSPWIPDGRIEKPASRVFGNDFDEDYSFRDYLNKKNNEPTLFSEEEMNEMTDTSKWEPDPTIIHHLVVQMIMCSLVVNDSVDLKQWITRWMEKKYKEIFGSDTNENVQFNDWKEFIVEFLINQYNDDCVPVQLYDDWDLYQSKIASALYNELYQYAPKEDNVYINAYMEVLSRYIYE